MSRNLVNFTRGSQLIGHFGFMFAAGLKAPLMLAAITFSASVWWRCSVLLPDHDSYLCWMRLYADIYGWFEFDPAKKVNLELLHGGHVQLPISAVASQPMVQAAWAKLMTAVMQGSGLATIVTLPVVAAFGWIATWFGRRSKESRHERGATLATRPALIAEIDAHNNVQAGASHRRPSAKRPSFTTPMTLPASPSHGASNKAMPCSSGPPEPARQWPCATCSPKSAPRVTGQSCLT
jgi:hypothetical protein